MKKILFLALLLVGCRDPHTLSIKEARKVSEMWARNRQIDFHASICQETASPEWKQCDVLDRYGQIFSLDCQQNGCYLRFSK